MPVYHFTLHAYRSWRPDHPRGYVRRKKGILPPDPKMARMYDANASQPPVAFTSEIQGILIRGAHEICKGRNWRLHAAGTDPTHVHFVISWKQKFPQDQVSTRLKNVLSYMLGKELGQKGHRWFVRSQSRKRVRDGVHLNHLISEYLPNHRGKFWKEGMELPA